jgi:hypothetical protein
MDVFVSRDLAAYFNDGTGEGKRRAWIETNLGLRVRRPTEFLAEFRAEQAPGGRLS